MSTTDIKFNAEIFRKDNKVVIAKNRHLADIASVRLAYDAAGFEAGRVLARNSVSGLYEKYSGSGASGTDEAKCVLFEEVKAADFASSGDTQIARGIFAGYLFEDKLVGLDSGAKTDLDAKSYIEADGATILKF